MPEPWVVETFYNTDPTGARVDDNDWTNRTLHGPFDTEEAAAAFMEDFLPDDTDVKDMQVRPHTDPTEFINPVPEE